MYLWGFNRSRPHRRGIGGFVSLLLAASGGCLRPCVSDMGVSACGLDCLIACGLAQVLAAFGVWAGCLRLCVGASAAPTGFQARVRLLVRLAFHLLGVNVVLCHLPTITWACQMHDQKVCPVLPLRWSL